MTNSNETKIENGYNLSGKECEFTVGAKIRSWDWEPLEGREDCYVEGEFVGYSNDGRLEILVEKDTMSEGKRIGTTTLTAPFGSVIFGEWNGRITHLV